MISSKISNDLFNKIRSKFGNIQIGNAMGEATANPGDAVFFDFEFREDADTFGRVSISVADGETVKVFYNQGLVEKIDDDSRAEWYAFLKELKDFAVTHQLGFDVRDITKNGLKQQDFKNLADQNKTVNTDGMSEELSRITKLAGLAEGLTGTARSSFENLDKTRLIIRHSKAVDENIPGDRTRNINSLYIENQDGERFKYPVIHLAGARAMARHVANGGVPHDDFGKHIVGVSEQIAQLNSFSRYAANKDQLNDSAGDIIEKARLKLETMRKYIKGLSKQKNYEAVKETFQPSETPELDDATKASLREKFTLKHMDDRVESALPLLHNIMQEYDRPEDEIADPEMDAPLSAKDAEIPTPVDAAPMVQQFLSDPENKLVLRKDDTADAMLKRTKFTTKNGMLSSILSDIASRMLTKTPEQDRVANFASAIANDIGREGTPFFEPTKDYIANKKIAFQLAKRYVDDYKKMQQDPEYAGQVRQDPAEFGNPKKDRQGRAKEDVAAQFESWANRVVENDEPMIIDGKEVDPSSIEYDMQDYGDVIAPISAAKFIDGTDLTDDQMADLEASEAYITWVRNDYNDRAMSMADDVNENNDEDKVVIHSLDFDRKTGQGTMSATIYKDGKEINVAGSTPQELANEYIKNGVNYDDFRFSHTSDVDFPEEEEWNNGEYDDDAQGFINDTLEILKKQKVPAQEGNEFALAVQKAKAAGMKPGDKFEVGGKEYTLKDAIEQAGLQLETFFGEDESVAEAAGDEVLAKEIAKIYDDVVAYLQDVSDNPADDKGDLRWGYDSDDVNDAEDLAAAFRKDFKTGMALQKQLQADREKEGDGRVDVWDPFNPESKHYNQLKALMSNHKGETVAEDEDELSRLKELSGIREDIDMDALKKWYEKYSKYQGLNGDKLPFGLYMQMAQTGVPTDGMEAGEARQAIADQNPDIDPNDAESLAGSAEEIPGVDFEKANQPITDAMKQELMDIMGVDSIGEDEITKAMKMLGVSTGMESYESVAEAKPDFLDMDKDGDKTEPMKKAIKDKEAKEDTDLTAIKKLAGI